MDGQPLRLADLLAALSVATDLGMGQSPEKAIRSCLVGTGLARAMDLPTHQVRDVYLATLLRHLGCTATAHEEAYWFGGDELKSRPASERADFGKPSEMVALTLGTGRGAGMRRPKLLARALMAGEQTVPILTAICEAGAVLARRLGCSQGVRRSLYEVMERWDGKGVPQGLTGDEIALPARISDVATQAVIFARDDGPDAAVAMVRERAGGWFDPDVADVFARRGADLLRELVSSDPWVAVLEAEPAPVHTIAPTELDVVAATFADMVDLKSTYTLGHSTGTAELAHDAARLLGMDDAAVDDVRRAALLHDLGRTAVSAGIWDKETTLTRADREQIRLHPYYTERILARSPVLEPLGRIAGMHHERLDGGGYHHGASAATIPTAARILAVADAYQALTQDRPHRPARTPEQAADVLADEISAGRFDPECVRAVLEAAGQSGPEVTSTWPSGLTDREVQVLRLVARGRSNKQVAAGLFISPRTAEHHVQNIYEKIGTSTRAAAALFAVEHGLLRD